MTEKDAKHLSERCNSMSDRAHDIASGLMVFAHDVAGHGHRVVMHEREVAYAVMAIEGALELAEGLLFQLDVELTRAKKMREMLDDARGMRKQYESSCSHMRRKERCDGRHSGR